MSDKFVSLIAQLEVAGKPDRMLDAHIFCATAESPFFVYDDCIMAQQGGFAARVEFDQVPKYTASLDAALTLMPGGWAWKLVHEPRDGLWRVVIRNAPTLEIAAPAYVVTKQMPALVICLAALKARSTRPAKEDVA